MAREHAYWKNIELPEATRDIAQMRHGLHEWGYCLIEDGLSQAQCSRMRHRIAEQAAAERDLGIAYVVASQQHVWALVNKGADFKGCLEHNQGSVQAGPLIERLLDETLGPGWNHFSLLSNISFPGCHPQPMHQDQTFIAPYNPLEAPVLVNTMYVLQDVNQVNGGTLFIPGSHRPNGRGGQNGLYGELPRPINLEAKAGTILMFDGRMLHGSAVNGTGKMGDPNGSVAEIRRAFDAGDYRHVGEISPASVAGLGPDVFTLQGIQRANETFRTPEFLAQMATLGVRP